MDTSLLNNPVERRKAVRLRVRPDLQITEQRYEGKVFHVVKDPVCLRYYRFNRQEYHVFSLFDGAHTMEQVKNRFEDEFKPHRLEYADLEGFARQLITAGLVQSETAGTGKHLFQRRMKQRRQKRLAAFSSILYWKIPVFDPDRILNVMFRFLWWIFTWPFFAASVAFMLAAVVHVVLHFDTFYAKLPAYQEFFHWNNFLYMWISLGAVKIIHEFGHGLSCKAFGGECHEMGVLLMCLSPALYCNVTDAWTISDKWKRIIISFAGIYVELIIAAIATFVWWYTPDKPYVNNIALCLMTLCSVSTFVFNANPLMRFDGYYIMADWLEIPNLRDRSNKFITNVFMDKALGVEVPPEQYMAPSRKALFVIYAITSWVYRWVVTFSIIFFLSDFLGPKLRIISRMIAVMSLASMFVWPVYRMIKNITRRGRLPDMKRHKVWITSITALALLGIFFFLPLPISRVRETALVSVDPDHSVSVGLTIPAVLESVNVEEGQEVKQGRVLMSLKSSHLQEELDKARASLLESERNAEDLAMRMRTPNLSYSDLANLRTNEVTMKSRVDRYRKDVATIERQMADLARVTADRDGVVSGVPKRSEIGKYFDRSYLDSQPLVTISDPGKLILKIPVSANEYKLIKEDLAAKGTLDVSIYVKGRTDHIFKGVVKRVPDSDSKKLPVALTQRGGGPVAVTQGGEQGQETVPVAQTYVIEITVLDADGTMRPGALVNAKIHCRNRTAAWWVGRAIADALDIGLY